MEILLGILTSFLLEVYKKLSIKFGKEATKRTIYLGLFALSLLWTLLETKGLISFEVLKTYIGLVALAVANYELIIRKVIPILSNKVSEALNETKETDNKK